MIKLILSIILFGFAIAGFILIFATVEAIYEMLSEINKDIMKIDYDIQVLNDLLAEKGEQA